VAPSLGGRVLDLPLLLKFTSDSEELVWHHRGNVNVVADECSALFWFSVRPLGGLEEVAFEAYREIYSVLRELLYQYPNRIWHFIPFRGESIHNEYRKFCRGRGRWFSEAAIHSFPAATLAGAESGNMEVFGVASPQSPSPFTNPRQTDPWEYYSRDIEARPLFSRGVCDQFGVRWISGTGSIRGEATVFGGDIDAQLLEIRDNLASMEVDKGIIMYAAGYCVRPQDCTLVKQFIVSVLGVPSSHVYVFSRLLCRDDLLVEIEVAILPPNREQ
jgi:hypothetical protein